MSTVKVKFFPKSSLDLVEYRRLNTTYLPTSTKPIMMIDWIIRNLFPNLIAERSADLFTNFKLDRLELHGQSRYSMTSLLSKK